MILGKACPGIAQIDLISRKTQIFQDPPPSLSPFLINTFSQADVILIPHDAANWTMHYFRYVSALALHKPVLAFNRSDFPRRFKIDNLYFLQTSVPPGKVPKQTAVVPFNVKSIWNGTIRKKTIKRPRLSFVGFVPSNIPRSILKYAHISMAHPLKSNPTLIRRTGIRKIQDNFPESSITVRKHYGGAESLLKNPKAFRVDFERSMLESDLVFCPRGFGNSSQRFYETLGAGRVPIVPNSNIMYPRIISPKQHKLEVLKCRTLSSNLEDVVMDYWSSISEQDYQETQVQNYKFYQNNYNYKVFMETFFSFDFKSATDYFFESLE